jgi:hypothetical protein
MPRINPISIPPVSTVEDLRQATVKQVNALARTIAQSSTRTEDMDMGQNRITSVATPVAAGDAATKSYVDRALDALRSVGGAVKSAIQSILQVGAGWIIGLNGAAMYLTYGAFSPDGITWTAKQANPVIISLPGGAGNTLIVYKDTGLTPGNTYTPTARFQVDGSGNITTVGNITSTGTTQAATFNATSAYQANGTAGTTGTCTLTAGHTVIFKEGICTSFT